MAKKGKRKRFNILKLLIVLFSLYVLGFGVYKLAFLPIRHIRILNTTFLEDQAILKSAKLDNYPSFLLTTSSSIRNKLETNPYIKDVKVEKKWFCQIYIYITEYKPLFYNTMNQLVLESGQAITDSHDINAPKLINYVPDMIYEDLISKMANIDTNLLLKISEIEYRPNDVDKERFLLTLNDGNYVYLNLYTFDKYNKYDEILPTLEGKKGILNLDAGNYFEIIN